MQGRIKIYLGYAPGVGKTYRMLADAELLRADGADIVIGEIETHERGDLTTSAQNFERIPTRPVQLRGTTIGEMDTEAILRRNPKICLVDAMAHTRGKTKRWEDVHTLAQAGIDVWTTMNVADLESLNDQVWQITGIRVRNTIPDWIMEEADEIVLVDLSPRALLHRLERGVISPSEEVAGSAKNFFNEASLVALRELALRQAAHEVGSRGSVESRAHERILVNVTSDPSTAMALRRGRRTADHLGAECVALYIQTDSTLPKIVERHLEFARSLHIETATVRGSNRSTSRAQTLTAWAHANRVTQILVSRTDEERRLFPGLDFVDQLVQEAGDLQVTVLAEQRREGKAPASYAEDMAAGLMSRRYARISADILVDDAIGELRRQSESVEMIYYAYVLDDEHHLIGVVSFRELFQADRTKRVRDIMRADYVSAYEDTECASIPALFAKHHLLAIPVIDFDRHMRGIITTADLIGLVQDEASEDIQKFGGMEALGAPYLEVGFRQMLRKRIGWLAILFIGEMFTATAMGFYQDEIAKAAVLALFLPLIISSGGNSGSQATTLVIRAMAMGELTLRDWFRVLRREIFTGVALGFMLGLIGITRILLWHAVAGSYGIHYLLIAVTIGCSLVGVVTFGTLAGSLLPFVLRRLGLDPASASAPFVATLVDVSGLIIYFSIAMFILRGTLL